MWLRMALFIAWEYCVSVCMMVLGSGSVTYMYAVTDKTIDKLVLPEVLVHVSLVLYAVYSLLSSCGLRRGRIGNFRL
jgi:hypothetical protein